MEHDKQDALDVDPVAVLYVPTPHGVQAVAPVVSEL
jgi:hypothetical protein